MQQRYYDPIAGRFLSVDPVVADGGNGALFNRYMYAANSPYRFFDPDGACTGSRMTGDNTDTCASTGGFSTAAAGVMQGMLAAIDGGHGRRMAAAISEERYGDALLELGAGVGNSLLTLATGGAAVTVRIGTVAAKGAGAAEKGGLNLFKWGKDTTTKPGGWKDGDFMLHLPDQGSAKANWAQNAGRLREQMRQGNPIYDSYRDALTGQQIPTQGFLRAERNLLESRGWQYNPSTGAYHPPGP